MTRPYSAQVSIARAKKSASSIIELMIKEMHRGISNPKFIHTKQWEKLFGPKQSMVVNLQKLVQALTMLQDDKDVQPSADVTYQEVGLLTASEMQMIAAWLHDTHGMQMR